ncbi:alpha/beta hydrolase [Alkalimarinus alittae]|uniref:Alpha/beta hydrolase n=1 Tax=Alkalimarinus alittae TaxID=2961619 RepID=A0ABY6N309_9ALTE|nr:alpha/beta hydrolase [Alkalimarinus alittae]UZE96506.1 alpha/beta hydrolase [Alkalimarinus alittae]
MTILFLILAMLSAWFTYNLYHPLYKYPQGAVISFVSGWLVGELVWHHLVTQVAITLLFVAGGVVEGFWGSLGLLVLLVSWWGMIMYHLQANLAEEEVETSLVKGLGGNYRLAIRNDIHYQGDILPSKKQLARPFKSLHSTNVEILKDIIFEQVDGLNLKLDIRRGKSPVENAPVLFQIHGGAWTHKMGSKNEQGIPLMNRLAEMGWVCVAISYRLSPKATFPDHIIDCKKALVWVKKHIAEYGGNPDFILVTGGSAGGHLSSLLSLTENNADFQPGFENEDTRVNGCVPFYGIYDFLDEGGLQYHKGLEGILAKSILKSSKQANPDLYRQASPINHIHKEAPPFMVIQGDKDTLVSTDETRYFVESLKRVSSSPVVYSEISGAQHAFDVFPSVRSGHVLNGVVRFAEWLYSDYMNKQGRTKN